MDLLNKTLCLLLLGFLVVEIFPQEQSYISPNVNIINSFPKRIIYNISTITPLKNNSSAKILDSIICIILNGDRIKIVYNYNDDLSLNYFTIADYFNGEWIISDKHTNTYNSEGSLESVLWEWFNTSSGEWFKDAKDVFCYDSLGNRITYLHQNFNGQEFEDDFKNENCYDNTNNLISSVNQDWIEGIWINSSKSVYTYTPAKLNDTTLFWLWKNNQWVNYQMNIFGYGQTINPIFNLVKRWQGNNWLNLGLGSFKYNINNNCMLEIWEIVSNNNWENWFRIFYEYDDNNNLIHLFGEEWVNGQWVPENELLLVTNPDGITFGYLAKEIFLYYSEPTSVLSENNIANVFNLLQNYPNPFNPKTNINYQIKEKGFVTLKVYDMLGREVADLVNENHEPGQYSVVFDASKIPSGVYIYSLRVNEFVQNNKMTLVK